MQLIAPSLLAADFTRLEEEIEMVNDSLADWLHLDVMDGRFVPNISFGFPIIEAVKRVCNKPLDVHLMIEEPEKYITRFRDSGADIITVHFETCPHLHRTVQQIKETGAKVGVALNPHTPVSVLEHVIEGLDLVCLMSVNPGFGGQKFLNLTIPKMKKLRRLMIDNGSHAKIQVDGGVTMQNHERILQDGADILVAGSSVFGADDPTAVIRAMKKFEPSPF